MTADVRAVLACHLPGRAPRSVVRVGQGLDNVAYEIDDELIVRCAKEPDPAATEAEAALLAAVAGISPLPVPEVVFTDPAAGVLAYRKLPGRPLDRHPVRDRARLAGPLGAFLGALHAAPAPMRELVPLDRYPLAELLEDARRDYRAVAAHVPAGQRRAVDNFLTAAPPPEPRREPDAERLCHNDLGAEHLLADPVTGALTGVIDWTDAAVTDPARDFARIHRDLGPEVCELTLSRYDGHLDDAIRARLCFLSRCALLEDLAYGLGPGPRRYADAALAHLARTFTG